MSKRCVIMRGVPGSGKSHFVGRHFGRAAKFSADGFFTDSQGNYKFNKDMLAEAHNHCLMRFCGYIHNAADGRFAVVDNTNVKAFEIAPYYRVAEVHGFVVHIFWLVCDPAVAAVRNIHGVPPPLVETMARSFEPLPSWWNQHIVTPDMLVAGYDPFVVAPSLKYTC